MNDIRGGSFFPQDFNEVKFLYNDSLSQVTCTLLLIQTVEHNELFISLSTAVKQQNDRDGMK